MIIIKKSNFTIMLLVLILLLALPYGAMAHQAVYHGKHYQAGVEFLNQGKLTEAIHELEHAVEQAEQAAYLRKLAEAYEANEQYQKASETYYKEAQLYQKKGYLDAYLVEKAKGDALSTQIKLFYQEQGDFPLEKTLAKYEPATGLYIGAFVEYDTNIGHKNVQKFNEITGKNHAVYYTYHEYGNPFPVNWAAQVKRAGAAVHLSLEPNKGLSIVNDNEYLREFAQDAYASGVPIFLRFASEMNGDWVAWNGDPEQYIEKFRVISQVMKEEAPNVAMVWAPNSVPQKEITKYYPGDDWVDWVGINLYSVCFFNGDPSQPADNVNPLDLLDFVYKEYAKRKPIMVAEYAATHYSVAGDVDATKFAITKMNMLYQGVKLFYPRVKSINWYSVNNLTHAHSAERRLNNFSLTENTNVLNTYKELINDPYYLSQVVNGPFASNNVNAKIKITPLEDKVLNNSVTGLGWIKTYDPYISKVIYKIDGKYLVTSYQYPFAFSLDIHNLAPGKHNIEVIVFDSKDREAARENFTFYNKVRSSLLSKSKIKLFLNKNTALNNEKNINLLAAPFVKGGRTLVPLRFISESLGAKVNWNAQEQKITINGDKIIELRLGKNTVLVEGKNYTLETVPESKKGVTFVPLRFISENLGAKVTFNALEKTIEITSE